MHITPKRRTTSALATPRSVQQIVRSMQQDRSLSNIDIWLKVPALNRAVLYRYLNGDDSVRLSERSIDAVIAAIESMPKEEEEASR